MVDHHPVLVRRAELPGDTSRAQVILERTDDDFIPAILDELTRPGGRADLLRTRAAKRSPDNVLKLYQPVQRTFNVVLFEVACDVPGTPRFDPARIESAGLVIRRVRREADGVPRFDDLEAWCQDGQTLKGWLPLSECAEVDRDPDATRRPARSAGHAELDRRLALWRGMTRRLSETVTPLFPAPPEVCQAVGKTILFGVLPLASAEMSEVAPPAAGAFQDDDLDDLSLYLKKSSLPLIVPRPEATLTSDDAEDKRLEPWINMLRQVMLELGAFGASPESKAVFAVLQQIKVPDVMTYPGIPWLTYQPEYQHFWPSTPAGELLRDHASVLVARRRGSVRMPARWPIVDPSTADELRVAAKRSLDARLAALVQPRQPRFDQRIRRAGSRSIMRREKRPSAMSYPETGDMYRLRAFIRARHDGNCPPHTVWSEYSEAFTIAPWYEGAGAPPVQIALPDPTDEKFLDRVRPNVAFAVPGGLFKLLQTDPKDLIAGKGTSNGPSEPGWICGFNIPIITICAFIALYIILGLLNMIFFWIPLVKICIPIPRSMAPR